MDTLVVKRPEVVSRTLDDKVILLCPEVCHPFRLNESGTRIWEWMDLPRRVGDLVTEFQDLYEVGREDALRDVTAFLSELLERNLIEGR
jgi:hypothetical protein